MYRPLGLRAGYEFERRKTRTTWLSLDWLNPNFRME